MIVRRAVPGEGRVAAGLIRASLPPAVRPLTIWHSPAVENYVESRLRPECNVAHGFYLLAADSGESAGVAEFRWLKQGAFLNHICITPPWRGRSLGRRLFFGAAQDFLKAAKISSVMLDVEPGNRLAYQWYRRLGFEPESDILYQAGPLGRPRARPGVVTGWAHAGAIHGRFGFSSFTVRTDRGCYSIGRLGNSYFRLSGAQPWSDHGVRAALSEIESSRRILLPSDRPLAGLKILWHSRRLRVDSTLLLKRL